MSVTTQLTRSPAYRLGAWFRGVSWRPRFTLRALLIVTTLLCIGMWSHLHWINERRAAIASGHVTAVPILDSAGVAAHPPWLLGLFGEPGHPLLIVHGYDDAQWRQAEARLTGLFPEAEIRRDIEDPVLPGTRVIEGVQ
ncbi:MAG: hypothetical protein JNL18_24520 [Planctomycetaceae bacterium]|nr:hypothetical protein [Planctomycetaceae bacterium]